MYCEIYDPQNNKPKFTPGQRREWMPIYPVYKAQQTAKPGTTWHYLFVCVHCGAEMIHPLGAGALLVCDCQRQRKDNSDTKKVIRCDNCHELFVTTCKIANYTTRHYCSEKCKKEFHATLTPTPEWLAMSSKPRDYNLRKIQQPARYDRYSRLGCDNVMA